MTKIKDVVKNRTSPMLIYYRINAEYLPKIHWVYNEENNGRIIGEACHIFDLFCFLTDAHPTSISVETINSNASNIQDFENTIITIKMNDGSCCSLLYTTVGSNKTAKEYMEIFFDGKSIIMNNFTELIGHDISKSFGINTKKQDKGHANLLKEFFIQAKNNEHKSPPIPYDRILLSTKISLMAHELALQGSGSKDLKYKFYDSQFSS